MKHQKACLCCLVSLIAASAVFTSAAADIYVDAAGTKEYSVIQDAVDAAASDDTVWVLPGEYSTGGYVDGNGFTNRVYINKTITLKAVSGNPDDTHIIGAWDPAGDAHGRGPAAVRGIFVDSAAVGAVVQGFTVRNCASPSTGAVNAGGMAGATVTSGGSSGVNNWFVDCVFTGNSGQRGAHAYGGYFLRCRMGSAYGTESVCNGILIHCLLTDAPSTVGSQSNAGRGGNYLVTGGKFYNCTFYNNANNHFASTHQNVFNCLLAGAGNAITYSQGNVAITHSVLGLRADNKNAVLIPETAKFTSDDSVIVDSNVMFFAPAFGDYRLLSGCAAVGQADASLLTGLLSEVTPPEGVDIWTDLYGGTVPKSGAINAGCCQETVVPAAGPVFVEGGEMIVDGCPVSSVKYFYPEQYPTQIHATVSLAQGEGLYGFKLKYGEESDLWRYPMPDDSFWFMPPSDPDTSLVCTIQKAASIIYADPEKGDDATADGSAERPYETLQAAVTNSTAYGLVIAAEGDYDKGGEFLNGVSNRVVITTPVRLLGAGAQRSFIWGKADESGLNADGLGPGAMRCASCLSSSMPRACIQGFTLVNGHSGISTTAENGTKAEDYGGALRMYGAVTVSDCVISNCVSTRGGAGVFVSLVRCKITCSGYPGKRLTETNCKLNGCTIYECVGKDGERWKTDSDGMTQLVSDTLAYQTTIVSKDYGAVKYYVLCNGHHTTNCIVHNGQPPSTAWSFTNAGLFVPSRWAMLETDKDGDVQHFTKGEARFASPETHDYRLLATSEALGTGVYDENMYRWYEPVMDGPIIFKDGKPTPGAYQRPLPVLITPSTLASGTITPAGTNFVEEGSSVTITLSGNERPFKGFTVDGELVESPSYTYTAPAYGTYGGTSIIDISPVFGTNWYVNAEMPDDSGNGHTPATAKRTLAGIMNCAIVSGDCIHAAPGNYNELSVLHEANYSIKSRVIIPEGVTLVSDEGPESTFITGSCATGDQIDHETYLTGTNAVRCVYMEGGTLRGFTVTGGRTKNADDSTSQDCYGGGIFAKSGSIIENCTITNCFSRRGGLICGGTYYRCRIGDSTDGSTIQDWSQYGFGGFYNCAIDVRADCGQDKPFVNCILRNSSNSQIYRSISSINRMTNCVIVGLLRNTSSATDGTLTPAIASNIVCTGFAGTSSTIDESQFIKVTLDEIAEAYDLTTLQFRGVKTDLFTDKGFNIGEFETDNAVDIDGNQRIYNAAIDLGPNEYDWRGDFASAVGGITVDKASPGVTTNALGKIRIPDGGSLEITPLSRDARRLAFSVENGELAASGGLNDGIFTTDGVYKFKAPTMLSLAFTGSGGYADILEIINKPGTLLILR